MLRFPFRTGTDPSQGHSVSECNHTKLNLHLKIQLQFLVQYPHTYVY